MRHEEARDSGRFWSVASPMRYEPAFQPSSLKLETIGHVFAGELYGILVVDPSRDLEGPPRSADSLFLESGVQQIAVVQQILGNVTEVNCIRASTAASQQNTDDQQASTVSFWKDSLSGVLRFEGGCACAVNWLTSANEEDKHFRLSVFGPRGSVTIEQDAGGQAPGFVRYSVTRCPSAAGPGGASLQSTAAVASAGLERQLDAWGRLIGAASSGYGGRCPDVSGEEPAPHAPVHAVIDLIVLSAMLQSRGTTVQIKRVQAVPEDRAKSSG